MAGSLLITLALALAVFSAGLYFMAARGKERALKPARAAFHIAVTVSLIAAAFLLYLILTHQYNYAYVFKNSDNSLGLGYLISTFWAGQEGSFLLWVAMTAVVGVVVQQYAAKREGLEASVMFPTVLALAFLLLMTSPVMKNPFAPIWVEQTYVAIEKINHDVFHEAALSQFVVATEDGRQFLSVNPELYAVATNAGFDMSRVIADGKGLNPLLLNFWMQIHPPVLFAGFALAIAPFAFTIGALFRRRYADWLRHALPWTLASVAVLGLGIMLGAYWAYGVLGWGGYWGWDPVENSSLIPWLIGLAAVHTMLAQKWTAAKHGGIGAYPRLNMALNLLFFILIIYSTFLTRSGLLAEASVHSFVDPGQIVYLFLLVFILGFFFGSAGLLAARWREIEPTRGDERLASRELSLFASAVIIGASALIIFLGTSAPIVGTIIEPAFYDRTHLPLAIVVGLLNGVSLLLKWRRTDVGKRAKATALASAASVAFTILVVAFGGVRDVMAALLIFGAAFTVALNADALVRRRKEQPIRLGGFVSHIGFGVFLMGVVGSGMYDEEEHLQLPKNEPKEALGYELEYMGYDLIDGGEKYAFNVTATRGDERAEFASIMYVSDFNNSVMKEPAIDEGFAYDLYVSPIGFDEGDDAGRPEDLGEMVTAELGDVFEADGLTIEYLEFVRPDMSAMQSGGPFDMGVVLEVGADGATAIDTAVLTVHQDSRSLTPALFPEMNLKVTLDAVEAASKRARFLVAPIDAPKEDGEITATASEVLTISFSVKPFVSLVWIGVALTTIGFLMAAVRRFTEKKGEEFSPLDEGDDE
jgi:cytochrome c-type biogenesis protein CcmF